MAREFDNTNTIAIYKSDKGDNPNRPDWGGVVNCEGKEYKIALWIREAKNNTKTLKVGDKFLSGQIQPKEEPKNQPQAQTMDDLKDDIPF